MLVCLGICELRLSLPARYDPQCPLLLDFRSGCLVRVLWACLSFPCAAVHRVLPELLAELVGRLARYNYDRLNLKDSARLPEAV